MENKIKQLKQTYITLTYVYRFLQSMSNTKELRYMLAYVTKASGFVKPNVYDFEEERQFIFESIMYSAMTLYNNGGASRSKLAESHKRFVQEIEQKNEEKTFWHRCWLFCWCWRWRARCCFPPSGRKSTVGSTRSTIRSTWSIMPGNTI